MQVCQLVSMHVCERVSPCLRAGGCWGGLGGPALGDTAPPHQLLFTLTFWLLVRQFVKEKLLKKAKSAAGLLGVTVGDPGEGQGRSGDGTPLPGPGSQASAAP